MNDLGTAWLGPVTLGTAATLQNGQCSADASASSASGSGTTLTVNLAFSFKSSFLGTQRILMFAEDLSARDAGGWLDRGTWVPISSVSQPPAPVSVTVGFGSGSSQTFTFTYHDANGYRYMWNTQTMFNTGTDYAHSCATYYNQPNNKLYLMDDAGHNWLGPVTPGTAGTLQNSQCTIDAATSWAFGSGDNLSVIVAINFSSTYTGNQTIYMYALDPYGLNSGWQIEGTINPWVPRISAVSLPTTAQAMNYSFSLGVIGGAPPYTWSITQGTLPEGVQLGRWHSHGLACQYWHD